MISNYEIKNFNGEETLFIFIDNVSEFANLKGKKKKKKLKDIISEFIKKNEIKFAGTTIAIVAGGLIIGNIFLNKSDDLNLKNSIVSLNLNNEVEISRTLSDDEENSTSFSIDEENVDNVVYNEEPVSQVNEEKRAIEEVNKSENITSVAEENKPKETTNDNNVVTVTVFRNNGTVLNLELEDYLVNVVAAEMPASFNDEALKAQAILARTYAKKAIKTGKVLTDTVSTQVYKDNNELKTMWKNDYNKYYEKVKNAVLETAGIVLKYNGDYIEAIYHSTSNGLTEDAKYVWGNSFPYLKTVDSSYDKNVKNYEVSTFFSYEKLSNILGFQINSETDMSILERNNSNRVMTVLIGSSLYDGVRFRTLLNLRSTDFEIKKDIDGVNIVTKGYGHGVGMSQYGANEMAKKGFTYADILNHYYEGVSISKE